MQQALCIMQLTQDKVLDYAFGGSLPAKGENELEVDPMQLGSGFWQRCSQQRGQSAVNTKQVNTFDLGIKHGKEIQPV